MPTSRLSRPVLFTETALVLGVSLGASAVWAVLAIVNRLTAGTALDQQASALNTAVTPDRPWLDLGYQLAGIGLGVVPALLAVHLLTRDDPQARHIIGLDRLQPGRDLALGLLLAAAVGVPGLGFYLLARALGINTTVQAAGLTQVWWAIPVLVLAALQNAVLEEVIMVGYLLSRWVQAGWGLVTAVVVSALLRGGYHVYQGFGGFLGNVAMGVVFGWVYRRTGRVAPLIVAHAVLDVVAFAGYTLLRDRVGWL